MVHRAALRKSPARRRLATDKVGAGLGLVGVVASCLGATHVRTEFAAARRVFLQRVETFLESNAVKSGRAIRFQSVVRQKYI